MTAGAFLLLAITAGIAALDWIVVSADLRAPEFVLKPLVMVGLIATALALDPSSNAARVFLIIGLVLSMAGDVFLMLPSDMFVAGLASFLAAHLAYIVALVAIGFHLGSFGTGVFVMVVVMAVVGRRIVDGARAQDRALAAPVFAYMVVLGAMVAFAFGTSDVWAIGGAILFAVSDSVLGWTRFVSDFARSRTIVMVTYHLAQAGLVLALI